MCRAWPLRSTAASTRSSSISDADDLREAAAIAKAQRAETAAPDEAAAAARDAPAGPVALERWTVSGVSDGGVADRVAVERLLRRSCRPTRGCSSVQVRRRSLWSAGETATGGFVPPRPFRVNAGPRTATPRRARKTTYLSEVVAGDTLVVASTDGSTREATVGRAKVEPRPCVQVDLQPGGSVFLQQAETVRRGRRGRSPSREHRSATSCL